MQADGSFVYTPDANFNGTDSFVYLVGDSHGAFNIGGVSITVLPVNDRPVAQNLSITTAANTAITITLVGTDVETPSGSLIFDAPISGPSHGAAAFPFFAPNAVRYTPNSGFAGDDSFTYTVSDGVLTSRAATVTIHVKPTVTINDASVQEGCCSFARLLESSVEYVVTLSPAVSFPVNVRLTTRDGTAHAGSDYDPLDSTVTIPAGETSPEGTLPVYILGDLDVEPDETFFIDLQSDEAIVLHSGRYTILNDDFSIGVAEGAPPDVIARVGQRVDYGVQWTHPTRWRLLDTIDVRLSDEQGEVLTVRFDQPNNTFSLFDPANGTFTHAEVPGSRTHFETSAAVMYLEDSEVIGSGPTGRSVLLKLNLSFKPKASGRTLQVEAFATDVFGTQQGFDPVGTIIVLPRNSSSHR
jgi:hypothetical protein